MIISIIRGGVRHDMQAEVWTHARGGDLLRTDLVLDVQQNGRPASDFSDLQAFVPPAPQDVGNGLGELLLKAALVVGGAVATYKVFQALVDEDFGGRSFPASFREEKIAAHVEEHGSFCFGCDAHVSIGALTVDHIVPWAKGGLTSRQNADVICGPCNSSKGASAGAFDYVRGRGE